MVRIWQYALRYVLREWQTTSVCTKGLRTIWGTDKPFTLDFSLAEKWYCKHDHKIWGLQLARQDESRTWSVVPELYIQVAQSYDYQTGGRTSVQSVKCEGWQIWIADIETVHSSYLYICLLLTFVMWPPPTCNRQFITVEEDYGVQISL